MADEPTTFRTRDHGSYEADGASRAVAAGARATPVRIGEKRGLLVELPEGLLSTELAEREKRARSADHVLAATETVWLVDGAGSETAYRGRLYGDGARAAAVFPLLEGLTLGPALGRARAGEAFAASIVAALAFECAHGLARTEGADPFGPGAIVIATDGRVRIRGPVLEALVGAIPGTAPSLAYLSPERIQREPGTTTAARLFSLGAMLYELCAGRALFASTGAAVQQLATWNVSVGALAALGDGVPSELRALLWTLLQRDPQRRATPGKITELLAPLRAPPSAVAAALAPSPTQAPYFVP